MAYRRVGFSPVPSLPSACATFHHALFSLRHAYLRRRVDTIFGTQPEYDPHKRQLIESVIFSAEGATGLKPGVERTGTRGTDLRADEHSSRERICSAKGDSIPPQGKRIGVSAYRRVGVCKASSTSSRPPAQYSVSKSSFTSPDTDMALHRYTDPPTRRHASQAADGCVETGLAAKRCKRSVLALPSRKGAKRGRFAYATQRRRSGNSFLKGNREIFFSKVDNFSFFEVILHSGI